MKYYIEFIYNRPDHTTMRENLPEIYDTYEEALNVVKNECCHEKGTCFIVKEVHACKIK